MVDSPQVVQTGCHLPPGALCRLLSRERRMSLSRIDDGATADESCSRVRALSERDAMMHAICRRASGNVEGATLESAGEHEVVDRRAFREDEPCDYSPDGGIEPFKRNHGGDKVRELFTRHRAPSDTTMPQGSMYQKVTTVPFTVIARELRRVPLECCTTRRVPLRICVPTLSSVQSNRDFFSFLAGSSPSCDVPK